MVTLEPLKPPSAYRWVLPERPLLANHDGCPLPARGRAGIFPTLAASFADSYLCGMTKIADALLAARPDWTHSIPRKLEEAFAWLEAQDGYAGESVSGYFLTTALSEFQIGPVFSDQGSLVGWCAPDTEAHAQLLPIAEIATDGSFAALWDDGEALRVVALDSEGDSYLLAQNATEFLALMAIGYREFNRWELAVEPDDTEASEAIAPFRAWVTEQGIPVPAQWSVAQDDRFTQWVRTELG